MVESGALSLDQLRYLGMHVFATPMNQFDGHGDGDLNLSNPITHTGFAQGNAGRPSLQGNASEGNGTFLRVNGLGAQTCLECHGVLSTATVPFRFGVGGVGTAITNVIAAPTAPIDAPDTQLNEYAAFNGRFINPPKVTGSGGIELVGREMTYDLQQLKSVAASTPNTPVQLVTKGVSFGQLTYDDQAGDYDYSQVFGVDEDLVVKPFGRKGEFYTTRGFDVDAMSFHFGIQPVELVGLDVDGDMDGVVNEIFPGELSVLEIFNTNLERPVVRGQSQKSAAGGEIFAAIGCAECHVPYLDTVSPTLTYSYPEVAADPSANVYFESNLHESPAGFDLSPETAGIRVPMYSDLRRHDMGPRLAEPRPSGPDSIFITARLWGVADTAPYLHDGRALTLTSAIEWHGGDAQTARDDFFALTDEERILVLSHLRTLRMPSSVAEDLQGGLPPGSLFR